MPFAGQPHREAAARAHLEKQSYLFTPAPRTRILRPGAQRSARALACPSSSARAREKERRGDMNMRVHARRPRPRPATRGPSISYPILPYGPISSLHVLSHPRMSYPILACSILSLHVLRHPCMSYAILACPILPLHCAPQWRDANLIYPFWISAVTLADVARFSHFLSLTRHGSLFFFFGAPQFSPTHSADALLPMYAPSPPQTLTLSHSPTDGRTDGRTHTRTHARVGRSGLGAHSPIARRVCSLPPSLPPTRAVHDAALEGDVRVSTRIPCMLHPYMRGAVERRQFDMFVQHQCPQRRQQRQQQLIARVDP